MTISQDAAVAVMTAANLQPLEPYTRSTAPWKCECLKCGAIVAPQHASVKAGQGGCKYCAVSGRKPRLPSADPVATMIAAGLKPLEPYTSSKAPWKCECLVCGAVVTPRHSNVKTKGSGCPVCPRRSKPRVTETDAVAVMRSAGLEPLEPYTLSKTPWRCRCEQCGDIVTPTYTNVKSRGTGCLRCSGNARRTAEEAVAIFDAADLVMVGEYVDTQKPVEAVCKLCDATVFPRVSTLLQGRKCNACGLARTAAAKKLDPAVAAERMREQGWEPLEPFTLSHTPWLCRHIECGTSHRVLLEGVGRRVGCITCADFGFQRNKPGVVYFLKSDILGAVKIGVTGSMSGERISKYQHNGWAVVASWSFDEGFDAAAVERTVLNTWKGLPRGTTKAQMPYRGYTETVRTSDVDVADVVAFVNRLAADQASYVPILDEAVI